MKKILILAHDFPPYNSIGGQRPYSWYKYFFKHGLYPVVITRFWSSDVINTEDFYKASSFHSISTEETETGTVIRIPVTPNLRDRFILKFGYRHSIIRKFLSFFYMFAELIIKYFDPKSALFRQADTFLKTNHADIIIATGEPFILFKYASILSKKYNIPWIADYRDCWSNNQNLGKIEKFVYSLFEKRFVKSSKCIVTVSNGYVNKIKDASRHPDIRVVYNGYWTELIDEPCNKLKKDYFELLYTGTIYPYQNLEMFISGFRNFITNQPDAKISISFIGLEFFPEQVKRLQNLIVGIENYFATTPRMQLSDSFASMKNADAFLMLASKKRFQLYAKVFEYIAIKKPVLMVVDDGNEVSRFLRDVNIGYFTNSEEDVCLHLTNLYNMWLNNELPMYDYSAEKFSRQVQAEKYATIIKQILLQ
ncbi:MAG TPA: hypothetical protein PLK75_00955 [Bacteroidales bacterium]|nr:hypothetical protein [Bacteroidales bacterium]